MLTAHSCLKVNVTKDFSIKTSHCLPIKWVYLSFSPLPFISLLFTAICKASSDNYFTFLHFFSLGMVLIPASCTMPWTSVLVLQSLCLSDLIHWIYFSLPLYNHKGFDLDHTTTKFRLKLKKVGKTTTPFRYDLNQSCEKKRSKKRRRKGKI